MSHENINNIKFNDIDLINNYNNKNYYFKIKYTLNDNIIRSEIRVLNWDDFLELKFIRFIKEQLKHIKRLIDKNIPIYFSVESIKFLFININIKKASKYNIFNDDNNNLILLDKDNYDDIIRIFEKRDYHMKKLHEKYGNLESNINKYIVKLDSNKYVYYNGKNINIICFKKTIVYTTNNFKLNIILDRLNIRIDKKGIHYQWLKQYNDTIFKKIKDIIKNDNIKLIRIEIDCSIDENIMLIKDEICDVNKFNLLKYHKFCKHKVIK